MSRPCHSLMIALHPVVLLQYASGVVGGTIVLITTIIIIITITPPHSPDAINIILHERHTQATLPHISLTNLEAAVSSFSPPHCCFQESLDNGGRWGVEAPHSTAYCRESIRSTPSKQPRTLDGFTSPGARKEDEMNCVPWKTRNFWGFGT